MDTNIKKGSRVSFRASDNGQVVTAYGVVSKVQAAKGKATVILDGAVNALNVPLKLLQASNEPLPSDLPHPMDRWGIRSYVAHEGASEETVAFKTIVTFDGKDALEARNQGRGGNNLYRRLDRDGPDVEDLQKAAEKWAADHGYEGMVEPEDAWLQWKSELAPYGCTATEYLTEVRMAIEAHSDPTPGM